MKIFAGHDGGAPRGCYTEIMPGRAWTHAEDDKLRLAWKHGSKTATESIAESLQRTVHSVQMHAYHLGLKKGRGRKRPDPRLAPGDIVGRYRIISIVRWEPNRERGYVYLGENVACGCRSEFLDSPGYRMTGVKPRCRCAIVIRNPGRNYIRWQWDYNGKTVSVNEHQIVMEGMIGRALRSGENVHHKNGIRNDNRPDNLELWSVAQPYGQRVEDKTVWAIEWLRTYAPWTLAEEVKLGFSLVTTVAPDAAGTECKCPCRR